MSDTPRTYAARMPLNSHNYKHDVVHIDTCIELERENAALRKMHDNMLKILATLTEDKERLDWLCKLPYITRTAIDEKREKEAKP